MKKSKQIQLVLITAFLASCNRNNLPSGSFLLPDNDSSHFASIDPYDSSYNCYPLNMPDTCQLWNYSFNPFGFFNLITGYTNNPHTGRYRRNISRGGKSLITRGGIGHFGNVSS
jgi:hypothetical protein